MRINVQQSLILQIPTLKHVSSYFAAGRQTDLLVRTVLLFPKMSTRRHIKQLAQLGLPDLNGATQLLNQHPPHLLGLPQMAGAADLPRSTPSTHLLTQETPMSSGSPLVVPSHLHHVLLVPDKK